MNKKIRMFVCGPTVYDLLHIGNARTFVIFDFVAKYLRYRGYKVEYVQNITDIDDKIIGRAQKEGVDSADHANKYTEEFLTDTKRIGNTAVDSYEKATNYIPQIIKQIEALIANGNGYTVANDGIYYDLSTFPEYGKLSGRTSSMADDAVSRVDDSVNKKNKGDFALWKFAKPGEPSWDAPFGKGRPGWAIEDTAITETKFGPQYEIHGGGQDLMFPHHEAEIAQQEAVSGLVPFVSVWMHAGFLLMGDAKMSKSKNNFETIRSILNRFDVSVVRTFLLSAHYRSPLSFSLEALYAYNERLNSIRHFLYYIQFIKSVGGITNDRDKILADQLKSVKKSILMHLDDDFNTPVALADLSEVITYMEKRLAKIPLSFEAYDMLNEMLDIFTNVLGVIPKIEPLNIPDKVKQIVIDREEARNSKNFKVSDILRMQIIALGYVVEDTRYGPFVIPR